SGICTSRKTKSGERFSIWVIASAPFAHSPTISMSRSDLTSVAIRFRAHASSSTINTRILIVHQLRNDSRFIHWSNMKREFDGQPRAPLGEILHFEPMVVRIKLLEASLRVRQSQPQGVRSVKTSAVIREGDGESTIAPACAHAHRSGVLARTKSMTH